MFIQKVKDFFRGGKEVFQRGEDNLEALEAKIESIALEARRAAEDLRVKSELLKTDAESNARENLRDLSEKLRTTSDNIERKALELKTKVRGMARDEVAGRYLTVNILSKDDEIIASRGEMITYEILRRAEEAGKLDQALSHTSKDPVA